MNVSDVYKLTGLVTSFQQIIDNLFMPLFEVTNDPASHPELHSFLYYVSQFAAFVFIFTFGLGGIRHPSLKPIIVSTVHVASVTKAYLILLQALTNCQELSIACYVIPCIS